jgi:hypothetical protein
MHVPFFVLTPSSKNEDREPKSGVSDELDHSESMIEKLTEYQVPL